MENGSFLQRKLEFGPSGKHVGGQDSAQQYSRNILLANVREGKEEEKNAPM
jgi:hypothetical protein